MAGGVTALVGTVAVGLVVTAGAVVVAGGAGVVVAGVTAPPVAGSVVGLGTDVGAVYTLGTSNSSLSSGLIFLKAIRFK